jgi:hypothetical protein
MEINTYKPSNHLSRVVGVMPPRKGMGNQYMKKNKKMTPAAALAKIDRIETANKVVDKTADALALVTTLGFAAQFVGLLFPAVRIPMLVGRVALGAGWTCAALTAGKFALHAAANKTAAEGLDHGTEVPAAYRAAIEGAIRDLTDTPASRHVRATLRRKPEAVELVL